MLKNLLLLALCLFAYKSIASSRIIYGDDNRVDLKSIQDENIKSLSKAIAGRLFKHSYTEKANNKFIEIDTILKLSDPMSMNVCKEQKFADQITVVDCTGFLVGEDLLVTAGHCAVPFGSTVEDDITDDCLAFEWLFDFNEDVDGSLDPKNVDRDKIYGCEKVVYAKYEEDDDFALIKLDRKVSDRTPLKMKTNGAPEIGDELFVMGHPSGLPLKYADGAKVFSVEENYFSTNLDTFGGNSGSPVFNAKTLEVEGILVRGDADYRRVFKDDGSSCNVVNTCDSDRQNCVVDDPNIDGEHVSLISKILEKI